jgi:hypothetical protein
MDAALRARHREFFVNDFLVDKKSFAETVDNFFCFSFLVQTKKASILFKDDVPFGSFCVLPLNPQEPQNPLQRARAKFATWSSH